MGIYGVGKNKALQFVMQGYRTLKDLQEKAQLTDGQKIGIELYDVLSPSCGYLMKRTFLKGFPVKKLRRTPILSWKQPKPSTKISK
jgi:hypothetical protein